MNGAPVEQDNYITQQHTLTASKIPHKGQQAVLSSHMQTSFYMSGNVCMCFPDSSLGTPALLQSAGDTAWPQSVPGPRPVLQGCVPISCCCQREVADIVPIISSAAGGAGRDRSAGLGAWAQLLRHHLGHKSCTPGSVPGNDHSHKAEQTSPRRKVRPH